MKRTLNHPVIRLRKKEFFLKNFGFALLLLLFFLAFSVQHAQGAEVSLAWEPNSEPDLAGYNVYYGTSSGTYQWVVDVGNVTTYTLTNLSFNDTYYIAATAYNTQGLESGYSNEVVYTAESCSYVISPASASFPASGGSGSVTVTTQAGCNWGTSSSTSWLTVHSGSGIGSGVMTYSVAANSGGTRLASLTVAGNVFTLTQSGVAVYTITSTAGSGGTISPSGGISVPSGGSQTFTITPNAGYKITEVIVDGEAKGVVSSYTFSGVNANHAISATFSSTVRQIPPIDDKKDKRGKAKTVFPIGDTVVKKGPVPTSRVQTFSTSSGPGNSTSSASVNPSLSNVKSLSNVFIGKQSFDSGAGRGSSQNSAPTGSGISSYPETSGLISSVGLNGFRKETFGFEMEKRAAVADPIFYPIEDRQAAEVTFPAANEKKPLQPVKNSSVGRLMVKVLNGITYVYSEGARDLPDGEEER
ncbi:MAG: fibronectin type III domain-containing protein [Thermodesulfobacteriota bacterium]